MLDFQNNNYFKSFKFNSFKENDNYEKYKIMETIIEIII